ncbi:hypothetical protein [Treponema sp. J25]|uniref:hypothetical protein n=1 Tax=Treponema sp. J25 TaxID=2094121 RepID=UPI001049DCCF|nr:hypothetical protein [Treponema sp. J25]
MPLRRLPRKELRELLFKRTLIVILVYNTLLFFLYWVGNFQSFLDSTQRMILQLLTWTGAFQSSFSFLLGIGIIGHLLTPSHGGPLSPHRISWYKKLGAVLVSFLLGIGYAFFSQMILHLMGGI